MARTVNERTAEAFARDEAMLVDTVAGLSVDEAAVVLRYWARQADLDGPDPRDRQSNGFWVSPGLDGGSDLKGHLDVESTAILSDWLNAEVERRRRAAREAGEDLTGAGPRLRAEALVEMARRASSADDGRASARPLLWVLAGEDKLRSGDGVCEAMGAGLVSARLAQYLACDADICPVVIDAEGRINLGRTQRSVDQDGPDPRDRQANGVWLSQGLGGRWHLKGELDTESGTLVAGVLAGLVEHDRRIRRQAGEELTGKGPQLRADALVEMARRATAAADTQPSARPLLWVITGEENLRTGSGACELAGGGAISAAVAQRLACDCDIAEVVVDADGRINLGRTQRSAGATQRRLLWLRDRGCRFPGCDRPPEWTQAHHVWFWEDGGPTDLDNLCLLCSRHHHLCHEGGFRCWPDADGELVFHRPDGSLLEAPLARA